MISGIGTDIVDIRRIRRALAEHGEKFLGKILSEAELSRIPSAGSEQYISGRFAAKEAIIKASGIYFNLHEVTILNDDRGKPFVVRESACLEALKGHKILLSISHEDDYAVAFAVIEEQPGEQI